MDSDRKYKQAGYSDSGHNHSNNGNGFRPKPQGPKPSIDITGPRLPRLVQTVTASRCYSCATTLPAGTDFTGTCPKCSAQLHCCKQCSNFESSTRFQCLKPILVRIPVKDQANTCDQFRPRVTVARDVSNAGGGNVQNGVRQAPTMNTPPPRTANDARDAFARLFKDK